MATMQSVSGARRGGTAGVASVEDHVAGRRRSSHLAPRGGGEWGRGRIPTQPAAGERRRQGVVLGDEQRRTTT
jgi:hypothetical protein